MGEIEELRIEEIAKKVKDKEIVKTLIENIPFAVWYKNLNDEILETNKKFFEIFNVENRDVVGKKIGDIISQKHNENYLEEDKKVLSKKKSLSFERKWRKKGQEQTFKVYKTPVLNEGNEITGIVGMIRDITETTNLRKEIEELAYTDFLTGTGNRRALYKEFEEMKKEKEEVCILALDLDNFKRVNDIYGHSAGDDVITEIAYNLKKICRRAKVFRIGGDEFVILWKKNQCKRDMDEMAQTILSEIKEIYEENERYSNLSTSIGGYCDYIQNNDLDSFLLNADFALYKAKEQGKNLYIPYTKKLELEKELLINLEEDLKKAIKLEEVNFHYQPQYLENGEIYGFEALFRWNSKKYSEISVIEMVKILEEQNIIGIVGDYLMKKAFKFIKDINREYSRNYVMSINISPKQIMEKKFVEKVKKYIEEIGVNPKMLAIEITETTLMKDIEENIKKLYELKNMGISISLDDFGIGYSSFNYLVSLPLNKVKIDRSFVKKMQSNTQYEKIVELIIDSSHSLNLPVVAEGIETEEELNMLKDRDTDFYQGYYFSRPLNEEKIKELLDRENKNVK